MGKCSVHILLEDIVRERRRNHRFNLQGRVQLDLGGKHFEFPAADISVSGVGVMLDVAVLGAKPAGEVGICTIESPDLAATVEAYVSVMRIRRVGHQHLVGLRFESINDEQLQIIRAYEDLLAGRRDKSGHSPAAH
ncbi:MAG: PilZ domain-containing protein [Rhodocyclales bacterium GT-UBC]|nr:MAG: PilZ domain-containing protein [Rhodocyclales bacterium GT-UBC]